MQKLLNYSIISEDSLVPEVFADQVGIAASGFMFCLSYYKVITLKSSLLYMNLWPHLKIF